MDWPESVAEYDDATSDYDRGADRRTLNSIIRGDFFIIDKADAAIRDLKGMVGQAWDDRLEALRAQGRAEIEMGRQNDALIKEGLKRESAEAEVERLKTLLYGNGEDDRGLSGMYYEKWVEVERLKRVAMEYHGYLDDHEGMQPPFEEWLKNCE